MHELSQRSGPRAGARTNLVRALLCQPLLSLSLTPPLLRATVRASDTPHAPTLRPGHGWRRWWQPAGRLVGWLAGWPHRLHRQRLPPCARRLLQLLPPLRTRALQLAGPRPPGERLLHAGQLQLRARAQIKNKCTVVMAVMAAITIATTKR